MKIEQLISEALTFKQARPYMKVWDPNFHKAVFEREPRTDRGARRIYLPFETDSTKPIIIPDQLQQYLRTAIPNKPYMTDADVYMQGLSYEVANPSRKLGIGKMLARSLASESDPDRKAELQDIKKTFDADPQRAATRKPDKLIVISRHPYDVAGMSTDRGWSSCMNLVDGVNKRYVLRDVKQGSIVAYLINADDVNIRHPLARILIRPYGEKGNPQNIAMMADVVYGTAPASFKTQVDAWVNTRYNQDKSGLFCMKPGLYADEAPRRIKLVSDATLQTWTHNQLVQYLYREAEEANYERVARLRPDADAILTQVTIKGNLGAAKYIKQSPSLATFQKIADEFSDLSVLKFLQNPSDEIIAYSIKRDPKAIVYLKNRTEKQNQDLFKLIQKHPDLIYQVHDPKPELILTAIMNTKREWQIHGILSTYAHELTMSQVKQVTMHVLKNNMSLSEEFPDHMLKKLVQAYPDLRSDPKVILNFLKHSPESMETFDMWTPEVAQQAIISYNVELGQIPFPYTKMLLALAQLDPDKVDTRLIKIVTGNHNYDVLDQLGPIVIKWQNHPLVKKHTTDMLSVLPYLIKHVDNPTSEQVEVAVREDFESGGDHELSGIFEYEPHKAMWDRLLKQDPEYVYWILNPPQKLLSQVISSWPKHRLYNLTDDLWSQLNTANQVRLIRTHPKFIQYVKKPSLALQMAAVYRHPELITLIPPKHRHAATKEFVRAFDQEMRKIERTS
jgi:hypothetical protein